MGGTHPQGAPSTTTAAVLSSGSEKQRRAAAAAAAAMGCCSDGQQRAGAAPHLCDVAHHAHGQAWPGEGVPADELGGDAQQPPDLAHLQRRGRPMAIGDCVCCH